MLIVRFYCTATLNFQRKSFCVRVRNCLVLVYERLKGAKTFLPAVLFSQRPLINFNAYIKEDMNNSWSYTIKSHCSQCHLNSSYELYNSRTKFWELRKSITNHSPTRAPSGLPPQIIPCWQTHRENVEHNDNQSPVRIGAGRIREFSLQLREGQTPGSLGRRRCQSGHCHFLKRQCNDLVPLFRTNQCNHKSAQNSDQVFPLFCHRHTWFFTLDKHHIT